MLTAQPESTCAAATETGGTHTIVRFTVECRTCRSLLLQDVDEEQLIHAAAFELCDGGVTWSSLLDNVPATELHANRCRCCARRLDDWHVVADGQQQADARGADSAPAPAAAAPEPMAPPHTGPLTGRDVMDQLLSLRGAEKVAENKLQLNGVKLTVQEQAIEGHQVYVYTTVPEGRTPVPAVYFNTLAEYGTHFQAIELPKFKKPAIAEKVDAEGGFAWDVLDATTRGRMDNVCIITDHTKKSIFAVEGETGIGKSSFASMFFHKKLKADATVVVTLPDDVKAALDSISQGRDGNAHALRHILSQLPPSRLQKQWLDSLMSITQPALTQSFELFCELFRRACKAGDATCDRWLDTRTRQKHGRLVFVIDEIGKSLDFAACIVSQKDIVFRYLSEYCTDPYIVLCGTTAGLLPGGHLSPVIVTNPADVQLFTLQPQHDESQSTDFVRGRLKWQLSNRLGPDVASRAADEAIQQVNDVIRGLWTNTRLAMLWVGWMADHAIKGRDGMVFRPGDAQCSARHAANDFPWHNGLKDLDAAERADRLESAYITLCRRFAPHRDNVLYWKLRNSSWDHASASLVSAKSYKGVMMRCAVQEPLTMLHQFSIVAQIADINPELSFAQLKFEIIRSRARKGHCESAAAVEAELTVGQSTAEPTTEPTAGPTTEPTAEPPAQHTQPLFLHHILWDVAAKIAPGAPACSYDEIVAIVNKLQMLNKLKPTLVAYGPVVSASSAGLSVHTVLRALETSESMIRPLNDALAVIPQKECETRRDDSPFIPHTFFVTPDAVRACERLGVLRSTKVPNCHEASNALCIALCGDFGGQAMPGDGFAGETVIAHAYLRKLELMYSGHCRLFQLEGALPPNALQATSMRRTTAASIVDYFTKPGPDRGAVIVNGPNAEGPDLFVVHRGTTASAGGETTASIIVECVGVKHNERLRGSWEDKFSTLGFDADVGIVKNLKEIVALTHPSKLTSQQLARNCIGLLAAGRIPELIADCSAAPSEVTFRAILHETCGIDLIKPCSAPTGVTMGQVEWAVYDRDALGPWGALVFKKDDGCDDPRTAWVARRAEKA